MLAFRAADEKRERRSGTELYTLVLWLVVIALIGGGTLLVRYGLGGRSARQAYSPRHVEPPRRKTPIF
jgi:hypothetical protein